MNFFGLIWISKYRVSDQCLENPRMLSDGHTNVHLITTTKQHHLLDSFFNLD